jgi:hypothetical protein
MILTTGASNRRDGDHFSDHRAKSAPNSYHDQPIPNPGVARSSRAGGARFGFARVGGSGRWLVRRKRSPLTKRKPGSIVAVSSHPRIADAVLCEE